MRAYISLNKYSRKLLSKELIAMSMALNAKNVIDYVFIDKFPADEFTPEEYIQAAFEAIDASNFIIVDGAEMETFNGIELGYAKARKKPIIYIHHENIESEAYLSAMSHYHLIYANPKDLYNQLIEFLKTVLPHD